MSSTLLLIQRIINFLHRIFKSNAVIYSSLLKCPICEAKSKYYRKHVNFTVYQCCNCGHGFVVNPGRREDIINKCYQGMQYFYKNCYHQGIFSIENDEQWADFIKTRINVLIENQIFDISQPLRCLEIGCAEGRLLHYLKGKGFSVTGCDVNKKISKTGSSRFGISIVTSPIEQCKFQKHVFDAIFSFHTFEHLTNPLETLKVCHALLKDNGKILLEVPIEDYAPDHLHFFSKKSARIMMEKIFGNVIISENNYTNAEKKLMTSAYLASKKIC